LPISEKQRVDAGALSDDKQCFLDAVFICGLYCPAGHQKYPIGLQSLIRSYLFGIIFIFLLHDLDRENSKI
jgi:hypothetical protein